MARIGTLKGTFLAPGTSRNKRKYTSENIGRAVTRMQARLSGGEVIPMHASHAENAAGNTLATAAHVTKVTQDDTGAAHFEADIVPTAAGRDIAAMAIPDKSGKAALKTVSIFGQWVGDVSHDEQGNETAPDLDITGIDFTHRPGVGTARIEGGKLGESVPAGTITESVDDAVMELEEHPSALALLEAEMLHPMEDGICPCAECVAEADGAKPLTPGSNYADPGYQKDKKPRYPLSSKAKARSAWGYINKAKNAAKYSANQLARIKGKIKAACKRYGIDIAKESAELTDLLERMGAEFVDVIEAYASTSLDNGDASISVSTYGATPADLPQIATRIARAALAGLLALDPDMDGDIDIKPAEAGDDDMEDCASCGASNVPADALFCPTCGQPVPGAEEAPATPESEGQMPTHTIEQVKALLAPERAATLDPAKKEYTTEELQALLVPVVTETASAAPAKTPAELLIEALGIKPAAPVQETELDKARRLVKEADDAAAARPVTVADLKAFGEEIATKTRTSVIEEARRTGSIGRRGLVGQAQALEAAPLESDAKKLSEQTGAEWDKTLMSTFGTMVGIPA